MTPHPTIPPTPTPQTNESMIKKFESQFSATQRGGGRGRKGKKIEIRWGGIEPPTTRYTLEFHYSRVP